MTITPVARKGVQHLPELDGVRGLAILAVLGAHSVDFIGVVPRNDPVPAWASAVSHVFLSGWGGVDLFFVLSGFLITGILLEARGAKTYFSSFYARRVLRIFPIYYTFLLVSLLLGHFSSHVSSRLPDTMPETLSYFFYVQNWPVFWASWGGLTSIWGAYWSLAVEEQFYMVWPALVRWLEPRRMFALCIAGFALGLPERIFMFHHVGLRLGVMQWPFSRLDGLFAGAAIALYRKCYGRVAPLRWGIAFFIAGAGIFLAIALFYPDELLGNGIHIWTAGVSAFALMSAGLVIAVENRVAWLRKVLTIKPLLLAGRYSYGMYVYHLWILFLFNWMWRSHLSRHVGLSLLTSLGYMFAAVATTLCMAGLSFHFFETPFLRLKRFFPSPTAPV